MLAVYGAGGFALQILGMVVAAKERGSVVCFVDDKRAGDDLYGFPVQAPRDVEDGAAYVVAIADPMRRQRIAETLRNFTSLKAGTSIQSEHSAIGEGAILCEHTIIEAGASIGRHFQCNIYSYVAHECQIGDFVTFAPRVNCNGRVVIGDGAYIGTGAFLKQGIRIGAGAIIGMGSVVLEDVAAGVVVAGNPARRIRG